MATDDLREDLCSPFKPMGHEAHGMNTHRAYRKKNEFLRREHVLYGKIFFGRSIIPTAAIIARGVELTSRVSLITQILLPWAYRPPAQRCFIYY